jgi:hypothetical protein
MESVASTLARLIASREAVNRADLTCVTGLARSTVTVGLQMLQEAGIICYAKLTGLSHHGFCPAGLAARTQARR